MKGWPALLVVLGALGGGGACKHAPDAVDGSSDIKDTSDSETTGGMGSTTDPTTGGSCTTPCEPVRTLARVIAGEHCTCVLWEDASFRCWGDASERCTGWGDANIDNIGDNETPASVGDVPAPFALARLALGAHSCAVTSAGEVRCWGDFAEGQLGLGTVDNTVFPVGAMDALAVELGTNAVDVGIGNRYTCALTDAGSVRCWGLNDVGQLGLGHKMNIGDDEPPKAAGDLSLGGKAVQLVVTESHACALLELGAVRCWGRGAFDEGTAGMLGYGSKEHVGDDELPSAVGPVDLPGPVERLATGARHTCAVLRDGQMFCWGANLYGQLGLGHTDDIGDDETPAVAGAVDVAPVIDLALYANGTCVLFEDGTVQCWGDGLAGSHGHGHTNTLGDDELPATLPLLELGGGEFVQLAAGGAHVCARTAEGVLRCWGFNHRGQLGYGHTMDIGDDELPASAGPVQYE